jgi:hypothetical protein
MLRLKSPPLSKADIAESRGAELRKRLSRKVKKTNYYGTEKYRDVRVPPEASDGVYC